MAVQENTRGIVVAKITKDIEHLLTAGAAKNISPIHLHRDGGHSDIIIGSSGKHYSRRKIHSFVKSKAPQVMFKISSYRKTLRDIKSHLTYVTRHGKVPLEDQNGNIIGDAEREDIATLWHDTEVMNVTARARYLKKDLDANNYPRVAASIVLSMPPGTDREKFAEAVKDYATTEFAEKGFEYLLAFHNDTRHPHAHLLLRMRNIENNRKINPKKEDIRKWREGLRDKMNEHGLLSVSIPSRLRGLMPSKGLIGVHIDHREMKKAMRAQGMAEADIDKLLASKSEAKEVLNRADILSNRQKNLKVSVERALKNPKERARIEAFTRARMEERAALKEALSNVAMDIVRSSPEDAGTLIEYSKNLPDPTPEAARVLNKIVQKSRNLEY